MISISYINSEYEELIGSNPFLSLEKAMDRESEEIDNAISDFLKKQDFYMIESEIMGELDEDKKIFLEAGKSNIFEIIGNGVISFFNKIQSIIKGIIEKIKNIGFKNKSNEDKVKSLLNYYKKNDPKKYNEIKDDVIISFKNGELNPSDLKSIKEMNAAYDEILKLSRQQNVKPNTLRAKFENMKKKFDNVDKGTVVKVAHAVETVVLASLAVITFKTKILNSKKTVEECNEAMAQNNANFLKNLKEMEKESNGEYTADTLTKAQIIKNVHYWTMGKLEKCATREQGIISRFDNALTRWITKWLKKDRDKFMSDSNKNYEHISKREAKARANERQKNREDSYDRTTGQIAGQTDAMLNNSRYNKAVTKDAEAKAKGQMDARNKAILGTDSTYRKAIKKETEIKTKQQQRTNRYLNGKDMLNNVAHNNAVSHEAYLKQRNNP